MNNRYDDPNWGKYGNPYRREWYHYARTRRDLSPNFNYSVDDSDWSDSVFDNQGPQISVWTFVWIIAIIFILSGFSDTARGVVFYGINLTETWYSSVDSMLDALGAPKLP